jgi:hypothetical protein
VQPREQVKEKRRPDQEGTDGVDGGDHETDAKQGMDAGQIHDGAPGLGGVVNMKSCAHDWR